MFIKNDIFVIARLAILKGFGRGAEFYYKIYSTKEKKSCVISSDELDKHKDLIYNINRDRDWESERKEIGNNVTISISSDYDINLVLHSFASNKKPDTSLLQYIHKERDILNRYTIIERGEDYVVGINNRGKKKVFSLYDIRSMSNDEIAQSINLITWMQSYKVLVRAELEDYINCLENKGDYKFKDSEEEKRNLNRVTLGANYIVRSNGEIAVKQGAKRTNIFIKNHEYKEIKVKAGYNEMRDIESIKILSGPKVIGGLSNLGNTVPKLEVILPVTLEKIESSTFENASIKELDLTRCKNLKSIGAGAFRFAELKGLKIPDTVGYMGQYIAHQCLNLEYFIMPKAFKTFDPTWIEGCEHLRTLVLPEYKMESWKINARTKLAHCIGLKEIYTSEDNIKIAREITDEIIRLRRFIEKRKIMHANMNYDIKIVTVKRTD